MLLLWMLATYLLGAAPWSVWLGALFYRVDPRQQQDGNPGAANAFRSAGWRLGVAVLLLDFFKAFAPVAAAKWLVHFPDSQLFWIALMPTLGHAFSVFLRFRGGRGLVVMFGTWTALTLYAGPLALGVSAVASLVLLKNDELRSIVTPLGLIAFLLVTRAPGWLLLLAVAQLLVTIAKISVYTITQRHQRKQPSAGTL